MNTFGHPPPLAQARWQPLCPACGCSVNRVTRRWHDRVLALLLPVRRYRCMALRCGWQGNLRCD